MGKSGGAGAPNRRKVPGARFNRCIAMGNDGRDA